MSGFGFDDALGDERAPQAPDPMSAGPWFVRHAGRRSGPFDGARLRTMARRGALGRLHSLSADGSSWKPATEVRAIFNPDGTVAAEPAAEAADEAADSPFGELSGDDGFVEIAPAAVARGSSGSASVRPVVVLALVLATAMLALPTSRGADGALAWWWSEGALSVAVRGLSAVAVLALWITAFLPPEPVRGAAIAATAAVMSLATGLSIGSVGAHALPAVLLVPMAAILVALDSAGSPGARIAAGASIGLSVIAAGAAIVLAVLSPAAWGFVAMGLTVAASGSLAFAGVRGSGPAAGGAVFWGAVGASCGAVGALFAVSLGALAGEAGVDAARGATTAGLVLAFAAISWAAVHESNAH